MKIIDINAILIFTKGIIIYGIIAAPNLPTAELNPNPNVLFNVPYDYVVHG